MPQYTSQRKREHPTASQLIMTWRGSPLPLMAMESPKKVNAMLAVIVVM
jgi:hypothetical protein